MQALGQTAQADSILPDFSQKYADKISVSSINASMSGDDWAALKEDIAKNFTHIYPDFVQKTQDFWKQNNPDYGYEMKINDNQYIAIALTKQYDVTDEKNRQLASQTRQYYYDLVDNLQQSYMNTHQTEQAHPMSTADKIKALQQGKSVEDASKNPQENKPLAKQNNMNMQILQNARQNIK